MGAGFLFCAARSRLWRRPKWSHETVLLHYWGNRLGTMPSPSDGPAGVLHSLVASLLEALRVGGTGDDEPSPNRTLFEPFSKETF